MVAAHQIFCDRSGSGLRLKAALCSVLDLLPGGLPQFVDRGLGNVTGSSPVLGAVFIALEAVVESAIAITAGQFGSWLARRRLAQQARDVVVGPELAH